MADTTVPGSIRPDILTTQRTLTQRGKIESALLVILVGTSAAYTPTDVKATQRPDVITQSRTVTSWKGSPLVSILTAYPPDLVPGHDDFTGYGTPTPDFIQQRTVPLVSVLTSYAAYNPAPDIIYKQFRRTPFFADYPPFVQQSLKSLINLTIKPAPAGDLTTQIRKPQAFIDPLRFDKKNDGAWHIVLMPGIAPQPPPPPQPGPGVWPLPSTITNLPVRGCWNLPGGLQSLWVVGSGCFLMTVATPATGSAQATFALKRVGSLLTNTGPVSIRDNGAGFYAVIVDGPYGYLYSGATKTLTKITDPAFLGATHVAFIDGWWIFNQPNTQVFYTPISTYSTVFSGSSFALKDGATDLLVGLYENKEELWLIGEKTTEVWYDAGGQFFPFQRLVSTMLQVGCSAKYSIARFNAENEDGLIWLALSERGQNVVIKISGFTASVVSTPAVNDAIASYTKIDDAIGYTYQEDGHEFYVLTFPTAVNSSGGIGVTWVYDGSVGPELGWSQRLAFEPYAGVYYRHRSNCFLNFQNQRLVGDFQNGSIYRMDRSVYTDNGWPLVAWRRTPHIWDGGARERVFMAFLQLEFRPGVGLPSGLGNDPQVILTISRDGGSTFGQEIRRSLGKIGKFLNRVIWRRLSFSRDAVIDVKIYEPVNRDIVGATLKRSEDQ